MKYKGKLKVRAPTVSSVGNLKLFVKKLQLCVFPNLLNPRHRQAIKSKTYNFHTFKATHSSNCQNSFTSQINGKLEIDTRFHYIVNGSELQWTLQ